MAEKSTEAAAAAAPAASGGIKAWLPLIITLVAMPALAYGTMTFLILPKMQAGAGGKPAATAKAGAHGGESGEKTAEGETAARDAEAGGAAKSGAHGAATAESQGSEARGAASSTKTQKVRLEKIIANITGTSGTRYIMATIVLAGTNPKFEKLIEENNDQLLDIATSTLGSKTIADLEKPGARAQIKIELMSIFNTALGQSLVKEIWIPEWAIQ